MLVALREGVASYRPPPTAADYVQDGLLAMWDGIENAGWGVHNSTATVWTELTGRFPTAYTAKKQSAAAWTENGMTNTSQSACPDLLGAVSVSKGALSYYQGLGLVTTTVESGNYVRFIGEVTTELVVTVPASMTAGGRIGFSYYDTPNNNEFNVNNPWSSWRVIYGPANSWTLTGQYSGFLLGSTVLGHVTSFTGIARIPPGRSVFYRNGLTVVRTSTGDTTNSRRFQTNRYPRLYIAPGFTLHCCRVYARVLSADEISANHTIDQTRFNVP